MTQPSPSSALSHQSPVAIVTGGGRGLGRVVAQKLAITGSRVVIADRDAQTGEATAKSIGGALFVQTDVSDPESVERLTRRALDHFGAIDVLINNAAITGNQSEYETHTLLDTPYDFWKRIIEINLNAMFLVTQSIARAMIERRSGIIVNVSSIAGLAPTPGDMAYSVSKHAVNMLTQCSACELAPHGIRVNAVAPSGMYRPDSGKPRPAPNSSNLVGRVAEFEDVADAIVFLCSDASRFIDGQIISVDGGESVGGRYGRRKG